MTYLTSDRDALAVALYDAEGFHAADSWETETDIVRGRYEGLAENLTASGAVILVATLADLLPDECWVLRSQRADLSCTSLVGGTFPNGGTWTEEMCCLPCRIAAALTERSQSHE